MDDAVNTAIGETLRAIYDMADLSQTNGLRVTLHAVEIDRVLKNCVLDWMHVLPVGNKIRFSVTAAGDEMGTVLTWSESGNEWVGETRIDSIEVREGDKVLWSIPRPRSRKAG